MVFGETGTDLGDIAEHALLLTQDKTSGTTVLVLSYQEAPQPLVPEARLICTKQMHGVIMHYTL